MKFTFDGDSNPAGNYVTGAANMVNVIASSLGATAINLAVSGRAAQGVLDHISDATSQAPDVAFCMIGTNDGAAAFENSIAASTWGPSYLAVMGSIIDAYKAASIPQIYIASPPVARIRKLCDDWPDIVSSLKVLCATKGVYYVPVYEALIAEGATRLGLSSQTRWMRVDPDFYHGEIPWHAVVAQAFVDAYHVVNPPQWTTVFSQTLASSFGNTTGGTPRIVIKAAALSNVPATRSRIRVTWQGSSTEPYGVGGAGVGHATGSGSNTTSMTALMDGASASYTVPQSSEKATEAAFVYDGVSDLVFAPYSNGGTSADLLAANDSFANATTYFAYGDHSMATTVTGYIGYAGYLSGIKKIEILS